VNDFFGLRSGSSGVTSCPLLAPLRSSCGSTFGAVVSVADGSICLLSLFVVQSSPLGAALGGGSGFATVTAGAPEGALGFVLHFKGGERKRLAAGVAGLVWLGGELGVTLRLPVFLGDHAGFPLALLPFQMLPLVGC